MATVAMVFGTDRIECDQRMEDLAGGSGVRVLRRGFFDECVGLDLVDGSGIRNGGPPTYPNQVYVVVFEY